MAYDYFYLQRVIPDLFFPTVSDRLIAIAPDPRIDLTRYLNFDYRIGTTSRSNPPSALPAANRYKFSRWEASDGLIMVRDLMYIQNQFAIRRDGLIGGSLPDWRFSVLELVNDRSVFYDMQFDPDTLTAAERTTVEAIYPPHTKTAGGAGGPFIPYISITVYPSGATWASRFTIVSDPPPKPQFTGIGRVRWRGRRRHLKKDQARYLKSIAVRNALNRGEDV